MRKREREREREREKERETGVSSIGKHLVTNLDESNTIPAQIDEEASQELATSSQIQLFPKGHQNN